MGLIGVVTAFFALLAAPAFAANVGFEEIKITNGTEASLTLGVWYPTDAPEMEFHLGDLAQDVAPLAAVAGRNLRLVVLSRGGGGAYESHYDTALALAHAGFVVASVNHSGATYNDQSQVLRLLRRPAQLRRLVSYMLDEWPHHVQLDERRIGAFGFSNGGFTVLVSTGGIPDLGKTGPYCEAHPDHYLCQALKRAGIDPHLGGDVPANAWAPDPRLKAAVIAAPAFGFAFVGGLENVGIPIQLWRAADDHHQPNPWYEEPVRLGLPRSPEYHVIAGAGHYDFLPPCGSLLEAVAPQMCGDPPNFDRGGSTNGSTPK